MTVAAIPPIEIPLERMTGKQKWELIQVLLEDLDKSPTTSEDSAVPEWHLDVLMERERNLAAGTTELLSREDFMAEVRSELQ